MTGFTIWTSLSGLSFVNRRFSRGHHNQQSSRKREFAAEFVNDTDLAGILSGLQIAESRLQAYCHHDMPPAIELSNAHVRRLHHLFSSPEERETCRYACCPGVPLHIVA